MIATILGAGDDVSTEVIESVGAVEEFYDGVVENGVSKTWYYKSLKYFGAWSIRYRNNLDVCRNTCGKQSWER